jgi:hypothetical protein
MNPPDQYRVVFDLSQKGFQWRFPAVGLIPVAVGSVFVWLARRNHWSTSRRKSGYFMLGFGCLWSGLTFSAMYSEYAGLRSAYRTGNFLVVEGPVSNFHPMPYGGHQNECFSVRSETFCYSDYAVTAGFNNSSSHGGPIREGLPVRVSFIGDSIVRLEVRADAVPNAAEQAATAETAKRDWQQRQQHDPFLNRMNLGFAIAALFLTAWWNIQPERFMGFWAKPPYKPLTVTLFKLFFAANLIGAIWQVASLLRRHRPGITDYGRVAGIAAAWIAVLWLMVTIAEWMARRQRQNS